ncbi:MAG: divergent polysaccharide deacetylase family protein [Deltaproteobacteria bacterium]|nr:divergent polysaccharide deacetylase family protein [Deltaproteobacteria bacterium]
MVLSKRRVFSLVAALAMAGLAALSVWWALRKPADRAAAHRRLGRCVPARPCLAVVIDDVGRDLAAFEQLLELHPALTLSVLPHAKHTAEVVAQLRQHRREFLLHLPLSPTDRQAISDEPIVLSAGRPLASAFAECLARVPGARGINNHMGSAFSADRRALTALMALISRSGHYFLDSRTTPQSQVCSVAKSRGVACLSRDLFVDDQADSGTIGGRLAEAERLARRRGWAIAIGHPTVSTLASLRKFLSQPANRQIIAPLGLLYAHLTP